MKSNKDLQRVLLERVGELLTEYGFDARPRGQSFGQRTLSGRLSFHLAFINHEADFDVTADIAIRLDEVEELVNAYSAVSGHGKAVTTYTMGTEIGNLSEGSQKRWTVAEAGDIEEVALGIVEACRTVAVPYFESYSSPENVLQALEGDGPDAWLHAPIHTSRAKRAVALAYLVGPQSRCDALIEAKEEFLGSRDDVDLDGFRQFVKQLADNVGQ